jgi:hypothetical protein
VGAGRASAVWQDLAGFIVSRSRAMGKTKPGGAIPISEASMNHTAAAAMTTPVQSTGVF